MPQRPCACSDGASCASICVPPTQAADMKVPEEVHDGVGGIEPDARDQALQPMHALETSWGRTRRIPLGGQPMRSPQLTTSRRSMGSPRPTTSPMGPSQPMGSTKLGICPATFLTGSANSGCTRPILGSTKFTSASPDEDDQRGMPTNTHAACERVSLRKIDNSMPRWTRRTRTNAVDIGPASSKSLRCCPFRRKVGYAEPCELALELVNFGRKFDYGDFQFSPRPKPHRNRLKSHEKWPKSPKTWTNSVGVD